MDDNGEPIPQDDASIVVAWFVARGGDVAHGIVATTSTPKYELTTKFNYDFSAQAKGSWVTSGSHLREPLYHTGSRAEARELHDQLKIAIEALLNETVQCEVKPEAGPAPVIMPADQRRPRRLFVLPNQFGLCWLMFEPADDSTSSTWVCRDGCEHHRNSRTLTGRMESGEFMRVLMREIMSTYARLHATHQACIGAPVCYWLHSQEARDAEEYETILADRPDLLKE